MSDNIYPKFSLDTSNIYPKITLIGLKEAVHFTTLTALEKIAEIQGVAGYSRPPQYVNAQVDSFWVSNGVWGTVESTNTYYSTPYRSLVFKTLLTTDEPINSYSSSIGDYNCATIIPWDNKIILAKARYTSGGIVNCDFFIITLGQPGGIEKTVVIESDPSITGAVGEWICPAGPKHFHFCYRYYTATATIYKHVGINYDTATVTYSLTTGVIYSPPSYVYSVCSGDGYYVNIIIYNINQIDDARRYSLRVVNGTSTTLTEIHRCYGISNETIIAFILRNNKVCVYHIHNYNRTNYYITCSVNTWDNTNYYEITSPRAALSAPCIIDKDKIMNIYLYDNTYYGVGFNVNNGSIIGETNFGSSPPSGYYFPSSSGFGRAELWSDNLFVGSVAYFGGNWYKCIAGDTTKLMLDYTSSFPYTEYYVVLAGTKMYIYRISLTYKTISVKWQDLSQTYVIFRDDSYLRTKAFNMIKPSSKAVIHAEGIGYLSAPILIQILDENNNKIGEGNIYDEVELSQTVNKAKLLVKGNNQRYNFLMLFSYGVLYE